jgi:hypothetical protein
MAEASPLHVLISGGQGDLARALENAFAADVVNAPGRKEMDVRGEARRLSLRFGRAGGAEKW